MAITETRLSSNSISNLDISNYNFFHTDSSTPARGAAIYVNKALKAIPRSDLIIDLPLVESCWVEIDPNNNNRKHIMIGCIYKHPTANMEEFTIKFDEFLNQLNSNKYDIYIMGDMNIDLLKSDLLYRSPIPMQDRKNRFSENLSGRRFLLTCFKTVTLRLFGFLFSSPDGLLYFALKRAKLGPEITLFAEPSKPKYYA